MHSLRAYTRQLVLAYSTSRVITFDFSIPLIHLFIQPLLWYRFLITAHYLNSHSSTSISRFYNSIPLPQPAVPPSNFELDTVRLFLKGCTVLRKPTRRIKNSLQFRQVAFILYIAEHLASFSHYLRVHFLTLLIQVRWIMRFGKLVAPRI